MAVTIKDVAKLASVSPSTVSRVLHDNSRISAATKSRVLEAMEELNYHPNAVARSLAKSSTKTIGLILPNDANELFQNTFFIQAMKGISVCAKTAGYNLMYTFSEDEAEEVEFLRQYTNEAWVEGIILFTSRRNDKCIEYLRKNGFPFAVIGRPSDVRSTLWVDNDNFQAMYNVVNYLVVKGCSSIAFLGGPVDLDVTSNRLAGYLQAHANRGLDIRQEQICYAPRFSEEAAYILMRNLLMSSKIDAIAATDDILAFGALRAMASLGLPHLPTVGFNNSIRGMYQKPSLTTVEINPTDLGYKAAKLLIDRLNKHEEFSQHCIVETRLIERETTKLPFLAKKN